MSEWLFSHSRNYNQSLARNLPAVHNHIEFTKSEMTKFVGVCIHGAKKVFVGYHGEQETFWYTPQNGLIGRE
jgi:hypothetical protein